MSVLLSLEPKLLWKHFYEICQRPHCSKHEELIREYIVNFAKQQGLEYKVDKAGNVVIKKPATKGMENKPIVVLQGHMDMVCEKNSDVDHDFFKDPIKMKIEDDVLTAEGTTLGADNGVGVATGLALLEDTNINHGPVEALFTVDEETGLTGAFAMSNDMLKGRIMLNLDSEDWGVITVGCAGGGDSQIKLPIQTQSLPSGYGGITVKVAGLRGGHSGVDAHEQRGNAIKILNRLLWKAKQQHNLILSDIHGGDKHNAIPREATATLAVPSSDKDKVQTIIKKELDKVQTEIKPIDPGVKVTISNASVDTVFSKETTETIMNLIHGLPHGVEKMSYDIPDLVETSTNLATVAVKQDLVQIGLSSRSSIGSALQDLRDRIRATAQLAGATVEEDTPYPGWKPNLQSKLLKIAKQVYKDKYGEEPKVEAIHAGLECGIIGEKFPGMDMISIGPTIKYPHSPEEQVYISTVEKCYDYVVDILNSI